MDPAELDGGLVGVTAVDTDPPRPTGSGDAARSLVVWDRLVRSAGWINGERVVMYSVPLLAVYVWSIWLTAAPGSEGLSDFAALWAAGKMVIGGQVDAVYDPMAHLQALQQRFPAVDEAILPFLYAPPGLLLVTPFGLVPYGVGFVVWVASGVVVYSRAMWGIVARPAVVFAALGATVTIWNAHGGQTGFLLAAATAGFFLLLDRRPVTAGVCLGVFVVKPHLALLLPLLLVAQRRWRTLFAAIGAAGAAIVISGLAFGWERWLDSLDALRFAARVVDSGEAGRFEAQSLYALGRGLGVPSVPAAALHLALAGALVWWAWSAWRAHPTPTPAVAAFTVAANLLVTPRVFTYDAQILVVAMVLLVAAAADGGFLPYEKILLLVAGVLPFIALFDLPATLVAVLIVAGLSARRVWADGRRDESSGIAT
jgi:hypothetical protein